MIFKVIMPPSLIGGGIKRCYCLTSVAYIGPKWKTERPRKTKIGTKVAHVTRDSDTTFKVRGQGRSPGRFTQFTHHAQAGAAVGMGTY